jgi:hypothetical protein
VRRLLVLGLALASCERAGDGRKTIETKPPKMTVTLADAGAEPRAPLRFHFKPGAEVTYERTSDETQHDFRGAAERVVPIEREFVRTQQRVVSVEPDGSFRERGRIVDAGTRSRANGELRPEPFRAEAAALRGAEVDARLDALGHPIAITTTFAPSVEPPAWNVAYEHVMIFPDEPVGPGARWHVIAETDEERASVDATLVSVAGDELELRTTYVATHHAPGTTLEAIGTAVWHVDLAGWHTTMHAQDHVGREDPPPVTRRERTIDIAPAAP